jgi:hypothetical protein
MIYQQVPTSYKLEQMGNLGNYVRNMVHSPFKGACNCWIVALHHRVKGLIYFSITCLKCK